jgi:copper chaperone CopZ
MDRNGARRRRAALAGGFWRISALDARDPNLLNGRKFAINKSAHINKMFLPMNISSLSLAGALALLSFAPVSAADVTVKLTGVHLCCKSCVNGVETAVGEVEGAKVAVDQDSRTVTLTASSAATLQKAADAVTRAGYFGKSDDKALHLDTKSGATGKKVQSLQVEGVHLCCGKCVKAVDQAVKSVAGVTGHNAAKGAKSFEVTGEFNDADVFAALQKEGLTGKAGK